MMGFWNLLLSTVGLAAIGLYLYVGVISIRIGMKSGKTLTTALMSAIVWPVTIWGQIESLYLTKPKP